MRPDFNLIKPDLEKICQRHHIVKLSLFGSILRDDFDEKSDVDILVEFHPNHIPGFLKLFRIEKELSLLFNGRKIDLVTEKSLNKRIRGQILDSAEVQYA